MSTDGRVGFTRVRDLAVVGLVAAVLGLLLVSLSYSSIPPLPRLAGAPAAVFGAALAVVGVAFRRRLRDTSFPEPGTEPRRPLEPLTAARALMTAKASSLAGAAFAGLWLGLLGYVAPRSADVAAARADTLTAVVGLGCAAALVAGALFLEHCCRTPEPRR